MIFHVVFSSFLPLFKVGKKDEKTTSGSIGGWSDGTFEGLETWFFPFLSSFLLSGAGIKLVRCLIWRSWVVVVWLFAFFSFFLYSRCTVSFNQKYLWVTGSTYLPKYLCLCLCQCECLCLCLWLCLCLCLFDVYTTSRFHE